MTVHSMIEVFNPTGKVITLESKTTPRISDLNGKVIGFMNNSKTNFDLFLARTEELLCQKFEFTDILRTRKAGSGAGAMPFSTAQIDEFAAKCDVVVNGIGEWGSCTSWSIHDSIELEQRGVPTVTICTDVFERLAKSICRTKGFPALPIVFIPHPMGGLSPDEVNSKADAAIDSLITALINPQST